ncbi:MAG: hypothetical protein ACK501_02630 [Planctomycetota bacterium]|jgi:hypothetical protein
MANKPSGGKPRGILSLVLVPALLTLVVTIVRLVGELAGWMPVLFNSHGPGPKQQQGLFGITLLIPLFGCWFGWMLRRDTGGPANLTSALLQYVIGAGVLVGGFLAALTLGWIVMPTEAQPGEVVGMGVVFGLLAAAFLVALTAWPRLSSTLLVYALLARLPVVAVTFVAVARNWGTHYEQLAPGFQVPEGMDKATFLSMPQLVLWPVVTMLVGGLCGCLGAALAGKKKG